MKKIKKLSNQIISAHCCLCGSESGYDYDSLINQLYKINGDEHLFCFCCELDLIKQIKKRIKMEEEGDKNET